jgi:ATP-dependent DNA ligase
VIAPPLAPMEARVAETIPDGPHWQYEPKWDGFRAIAFRDGGDVYLQSREGKPFNRYFPEVVAALEALSARRFVLDGELVVPVDGALSFDDLSQRIHPAASRVATLSRSHPATYIVFDLLADTRGDLLASPLTERRVRLEAFAATAFPATGSPLLSPATTDRAVVDGWFSQAGNALDGVVAKRRDVAYASGERTGMVKIKPMRTADCVIGGYRLATDGKTLGSLLLGLYDDAQRLDYVGFCSGYTAAEKALVLAQLTELRTEASFTARVPGGPSRWNRGKDTTWIPVRPELVLEVGFDQVSSLRFRHGTRPLRFRPDKSPAACTLDQVALPDRTLAALGNLRLA